MATNLPPLPPDPLKEAREELDYRVGKLKEFNQQIAQALLPLVKLHQQDDEGWLQPLRKVCFRSDTRPFSDIFQNGFIDRQTEKQYPHTLQELKQGTFSQDEKDRRIRSLQYPELPRYRNPLHYFPEDSAPRFDIDPVSSVALTRRLGMAPIFPLDEKEEESWIYAVWVDRAYMTYHRQISDGHQNIAAAKEVAVRYVSSQHIIAAVRCTRHVSKADPMKYIRYRLTGEIQWNPAFAGPGPIAAVEEKFNRFLDVEHLIRWNVKTNDILVERISAPIYKALDIDGITTRKSAHANDFQVSVSVGYMPVQHETAYQKFRKATKGYKALGGILTEEDNSFLG